MFYEGLYLYQKTGVNTARTLYLWVLFPSWIRIQQLKLMRIHADRDPQPCGQSLH
jgi:hypothetical protein